METFTGKKITGQKFELVFYAHRLARDKGGERSGEYYRWVGICVLFKLETKPKPKPQPFDFRTAESVLPFDLPTHVLYATLDFSNGSTDALQHACSHAEAVDMLGEKILELLNEKKYERMPWIEMPYLEKEKILKSKAA